MNLTNRSRATNALLLFAIVLCADVPLMAQESDVDVVSPSRITQSLISRNELNRLLNQPPQDRNPLRRSMPQPQSKQIPNRPSASPLPSKILDSNVLPTSWQEEQPAASVDETRDTQDQSAATFGPMPSFEMQSLWNILDKLTEIPIDKLQKEIAERRNAISTSLTIDDETKALRLEQIEIAEAAARQATTNTSARAEYQNRMASLKTVLEQLRQDSKTPQEPSPIKQGLTVDEMQSILLNLQTDLDLEKSNVKKIQDRIQQRDARMEAIPDERRKSRVNVNELHEEFLRKQAKGTEDIEVLLALRAKELEASTHIQFLDAEASWHDQSQEKLPLEKAIYQQRLQRLEQEVDAWNKAIADRKRAELEEQVRVAKAKAFDAHPALQEFSQETTKLAQARAELAEKIGALQNERLRVSKQAEEVNDQFDRLDESIRETGKDHSSDLLIEVHRNLIRPFEGMARIQKIASEKKLTRGTILKLRSEEELISDPQTFIREQLNIENDENVADTTLFAMAEKAIETHREQLTALIGDNEDYQTLLVKLQPDRENLLKKIAETRELVDTHALWIQSADPFSVELIAKSGEGAQEFFDYKQWHDLGNSIIHRVTNRPYESIVGMLGLLVAFVVGRKFKG